MLEHLRYVPVVRWRAAEQDALTELAPTDRSGITPIIEVLPSKVPLYSADSRAAFLRAFCVRLKEVWGAAPAFVDLRYLGPQFVVNGESPWRALLLIAAELGLDITPVIGLPRHLDVLTSIFGSIADRKRGVALRLTQMDLILPSLKRRYYLDRFFEHFRLRPSQIDLLVDLEFTSHLNPRYADICADLPFLKEWRSFAVLSGDFPADLQEFPRGDAHRKRRADWAAWQEQVIGGAPLPRIPSYGDYTVQYATYRPFVGVPNPSISVRYTLDDVWLILRGEALRPGGPGCEQWNAWAQILCDMPEYKSRDFSFGDRFIFEKSLDGASTGNIAEWITAGINHHLVLAGRQVAALRQAEAESDGLSSEAVFRSSEVSVVRRGRGVASSAAPDARLHDAG